MSVINESKKDAMKANKFNTYNTKKSRILSKTEKIKNKKLNILKISGIC